MPSRRVLATLIRLLRDFELAEEALHEAFTAAIESWPTQGVPANPRAWHNDGPVTRLEMLPNDRITPLFQATAQATEGAITNALLAAETMTGANDLRIYALPVDRMLGLMKKYGRLP